MNKLHTIAVICIFLISNVALSGKDEPEQKTTLPPFDELFGLVRSNVKSLNPDQLNQAAVRGLLEQLSSDVILITNQPPVQADFVSQLVMKKAVYEGAYGYIRVAQVEAGLGKQVHDAHQQLLTTNKLKGMVLDLRFAPGQDYNEAASVADLFVAEEGVLMELGETTLRSTAKSEPIAVPVVVLVNEQTAGAAEALAAALRHSAASLVIGKPTAGRARTFKEFTLASGQKVKLAIGKIRLADGSEISGSGLAPDVPVSVRYEEELAYLADPYRVLPTRATLAHADTGNGGTNAPNRLRGPRNESELIRLRRNGFDLDVQLPESATDEPAIPVLNDPALARAVDFLKGLALVQKRR